jgi:hypothetical protein
MARVVLPDSLGVHIASRVYAWSRPKNASDYSHRMELAPVTTALLRASLPWCGNLTKNKGETTYSLRVGSAGAHHDVVCIVNHRGRVHLTMVASATRGGGVVHVGNCLAFQWSPLDSPTPVRVCRQTDLNPAEAGRWCAFSEWAQRNVYPVICMYMRGSLMLHETTNPARDARQV